jgi:hypothetical protein
MTRGDKELLIILRDNINKLRTGLCFLATQLRWERILTADEEIRIIQYISIHRPKGSGKFEKYYFWPPREQEPRIHWINKQLEK